MKHWEVAKLEQRYGKRITLKGCNERILSVTKTDEGMEFMEECDGWFSHTYTKEEVIELLDELKDWINKT